MTVPSPDRAAPAAGGPAEPDDIGVTWDDPSHASLSWARDDMHMPFPLAPLAADYVRTLAAGMNGRYELLGGFPQRWRVGIWSGYAYFAFDLDPALKPEVDARWADVLASQLATVGRWWPDEVIPELRSISASIASIDVEAGNGPDVAEAWTAAWAATERAWILHFVAIIGPYQVVEDVADLAERAVPDLPAADGARLIQGYGDELFAVEEGIEALANLAADTPAIAARLAKGDGVEPADLADLEGGPAFLARLDAFLAEHGHLGQAFDDLTLPSWADEPRLVLAELAKRVDRPMVSAARRRARLRAEAEVVADRVRAALADRPEDLAAFERTLAAAREIGPLTEGHNYWIDRLAQARLRTLAIRVGRRLVRDDVIGHEDDVFFLHRDEVGDALRAPWDLRSLVADRRAEHARWSALRAPAAVGAPPQTPEVADRFDGGRIASDDPNVLAGTGASPGVVRGPARVTRSPDDFSRIQPGDVIVCPSSNPSWVPVFAIAGGLVTDTGGVLCHAAVVAREFGLPAVVGTGDATLRIGDGRLVEIDGVAGTVRLL